MFLTDFKVFLVADFKYDVSFFLALKRFDLFVILMLLLWSLIRYKHICLGTIQHFLLQQFKCCDVTTLFISWQVQ